MNKENLIRNIKAYHESQITRIGFKILHMIEVGDLSDFSTSYVFSFLDNGSPYSMDIASPFMFRRGKLESPGVNSQNIGFHYRYALVYTVWKKLEDQEVKLPAPDVDNEGKLERLKDELEEVLETTFLENFFASDKIEDLDDIKDEIEREIDSRLERINRKKQKEIAEGTIDQDLVDEFERKLVEAWRNNATVKEIFRRKDRYESNLESRPPENADRHFGFLRLMERSYFIEEQVVTWSKTADQTLGRSLGRDEGMQILSKIADYCNLEEEEGLEDSELLENILGSSIIDSSSILFIDGDTRETVRELSEFERKDTKKGFMQGVINHQDEAIRVFPVPNLESIMLMNMDSCPKVIQYSAFEELEKEYYVNVDEISDSEAEELAEENDGETLEYKTKVKLRAAEKFRIEGGDKSAVKGYKT